ncbi:hypothetical protein C0J52_22074 [Blattella germanica]|nr:hypothetical protein C0J52_22074 [Blattella germanica]
MADVTELRMNVAALSRVDPYAKDILDTATHVALYKFNTTDNEWEKTDVEGALFVYSRNGEPYHSILIMNRLNTNNLVEPVTQGLDLQLQEPFLLYRNTSPRPRIFGIWFYDKDECIRIASVLDKLVKESEMSKIVSDKVAMKNKRIGSGDNVDICTMLSKAQESYNSNKTQTIPRHAPPEECKPDMPQGVMEFFAKVSGGATHFPADKVSQSAGLFESAGLFGHPQQRSGAVEHVNDTGDSQLKPLLLRLMSNPAHSVEHIEKQQRSVTPQSEAVSTKRNKGKVQSNKDNKHNSAGTSKPRTISSSGLPDATKSRQGLVLVTQPNSSTPKGLENGMSFLRITSPTTTCPQMTTLLGTELQAVTSTSATIDNSTSEQRPLSAPLCSGMETPQKPTLIPPTMFTSSVRKETSNRVEAVNTTTIVNSSHVSTKPELLTMTTGSGIADEDNILFRPEPLTRNQFHQALCYLLKNDPEFVTKLHEAYVKSFTEMVL